MSHDTARPSRRRTHPTALGATLAALALALALPAVAADWPQWRGPNRDGRSPETGLLGAWPEGGPPLAWRTSGLGAGYSSLSVSDGRITTLGDLGDDQTVIAVAEDGGKLLWKTRVGDAHVHDYGGPRSTPTAVGDRLYVMTTAGDVVCLDAATGTERWRRSLPAAYDARLMQAMGSYDWRFAESPLVDGERVVVTPGHVAAMMVALHAKTGEEIWRTRGRRLGPVGADGAAYASAVVSTAAGTRQYVQLVGRGLIGVAAQGGELLWGYNRIANDVANIPTPLVTGDLVFTSTGYGTGAALVRVGAAEEGLEADELYFLEANTFQNHHGGMILHEGAVFTGTGHNKGFPIAVDLRSGAVLWGPVRNAGRGSAAIAYADGRLYLRYQDGRMILAEASRDAYRERGSFVIPDVEKESWSHPVIANGKLLLREQDHLYAYDVRAEASAQTRPQTTEATPTE